MLSSTLTFQMKTKAWLTVREKLVFYCYDWVICSWIINEFLNNIQMYERISTTLPIQIIYKKKWNSRPKYKE
jgi:hypothetical protein